MGFWTISIGPVKQVTDGNLKAALKIIIEEVRSYRVPSKVMIARYALEKRRFNQGEIEAFEEIASSTAEEVDTTAIALRELAAPLMETPSGGPTFHEYLNGASSSASRTSTSHNSSNGRQTNA